MSDEVQDEVPDENRAGAGGTGREPARYDIRVENHGVAQGNFGVVDGPFTMSVHGSTHAVAPSAQDLSARLAAELAELRRVLEGHRGELPPDEAAQADKDLAKAEDGAHDLPADPGRGPGVLTALKRLRATVESVGLLARAVDGVLATLRHMGVG